MADHRDKSRVNRDNETKPKKDNPDAITGAPGSHPVGTGVGAAGGGAAGAAIGMAAGPPGALAGAVIGAAVGAVAGGYAGKGVAEAINPTAEDAYWRENYRKRPYVREGEEYEHYRPAYQYGWESRVRHRDRTFDEAEPELRQNWETQHARGGMTWEQARLAVRDAYTRTDEQPSQQAGATPPGSQAPEVGRGSVPDHGAPPDRREP